MINHYGLNPIAANINQTIILLIILPQLSLNIINYYLVICAIFNISQIII